MELEHSTTYITVERIVVGNGRMVCYVKLSLECPLSSSLTFMRELLKTHPHLPHHVCKNKQGNTFEAVMNSTSLIHVFEHVVIDCMVQESQQTRGVPNPPRTRAAQAIPSAQDVPAARTALTLLGTPTTYNTPTTHSAPETPPASNTPTPSADTLFVGNSQWVSKAQKTGKVELSFTDDIMALRAIKNAAAHLNAALAQSYCI